MKESFAPTLLSWYDTNKRLLPWRETQDPYRIWISEIILQQTRVAQGWDYFLRFLDRFPDIKTLAEAEEEDVLHLWQGLGYYSRARNLHAAAKIILEQYGGQFPTSWQQVRALPGIGDYTASAICSFAYNQPTAVVDGNVYRVLSRLFGISTPIDSSLGKKEFSQLANVLIDPFRPGDYNQAIMDFGATACTPKNPICNTLLNPCPFAADCRAFAEHQVDELPVKTKKNTLRQRFFHYLHLHYQGQTFLCKRIREDIWKHLYEYPLLEETQLLEESQLLEHPQIRSWFRNAGTIRSLGCTTMPKHQLSHQCIHSRFFEWEIEKIPPEWNSEGNDWICIDADRLQQFPVSRLMETYLAKKQNCRSSL